MASSGDMAGAQVLHPSTSGDFSGPDDATSSDSGSQFSTGESGINKDPLRLGLDNIELARTPLRRRTATVSQDEQSSTADQLGPRDFEPYQPSPRDHQEEAGVNIKYKEFLTPVHNRSFPNTSSPLSLENTPSNNSGNQSPQKYGKNGRRRLCKDAFSRPRHSLSNTIRSETSSRTSRMPPSSPPPEEEEPKNINNTTTNATISGTPIVHPVMKNEDQYVYRLRKDDDGNDILVPVYVDNKKISYNQFPYANSMTHIPRFPYREIAGPFLGNNNNNNNNNCPSPEGTPALSDGSSIQNSPAVLPTEWATPTMMMGLGELQGEDVSLDTETEQDNECEGTSANSSQSAFASSPIITPEIRAMVPPVSEKQKQSRKLAFTEPIIRQPGSEDILHDPEDLYKDNPQPAKDSHPFLVKRTTSADLCPKPLARALLVCGICFPPIWLLIAAGTFDHSVGHIDRNTKLAAMVLSSITMTAAVVGICVGIGVGETAGR